MGLLKLNSFLTCLFYVRILDGYLIIQSVLVTCHSCHHCAQEDENKRGVMILSLPLLMII